MCVYAALRALCFLNFKSKPRAMHPLSKVNHRSWCEPHAYLLCSTDHIDWYLESWTWSTYRDPGILIAVGMGCAVRAFVTKIKQNPKKKRVGWPATITNEQSMITTKVRGRHDTTEKREEAEQSVYPHRAPWRVMLLSNSLCVSTCTTNFI